MTIEPNDEKPYRLSHTEREQVRLTNYYRMILFRNRILVTLVPFEYLKRKPVNKHCALISEPYKIIKDLFPLLLIDDQMTCLCRNKFFTILDLASGYYQIPMSSKCQHLTGFVTLEWYGEFKRINWVTPRPSFKGWSMEFLGHSVMNMLWFISMTCQYL